MNIEDICPVSDSLDFFSRKWVLCILMDMFRGKKYFTDFQQSNPELSNHVLSQTLKYSFLRKVYFINDINYIT